MRLLKVHPQQGAPGFAQSLAGYQLPPGLAHGTRLLVTSVSGADVEVEDEQRRKWLLPHWQVDCGSLYEVESGTWAPTYDPRVRSFLARELATPPGSYAGAKEDRAEACRLIREEIERWG